MSSTATAQRSETLPSIDEEVKEFKKHLRKNTDLVDGSINQYGAKVAKLDKPLDFERMDVEEIIYELDNKISRGEGRSAIKHYLSFLRRRKKWPIETRKTVAYVQTEIDDWSLKTSSGLNKEDIKRKFLRVQEIEGFHRHIKLNTRPAEFLNSERKTNEYKILPIFLFETACRIEEALSIKVDNIKWAKGEIKLTNTKRDKIRKVNFDQSLPMIREHIEKYGIENQLFAIDREDDYRPLNDRFKRVGEELFGRNVTTHWFRHSFATNRAVFRMREGVSKGEIKDEIKEYLGHDSVDTTEKYIGAASELERENIYKNGKSFDMDL